MTTDQNTTQTPALTQGAKITDLLARVAAWEEGLADRDSTESDTNDELNFGTEAIELLKAVPVQTLDSSIPVTVEMLRDEIESAPDLAEDVAEKVQAMSDERLNEALETAFRREYESMWYTILDGTRARAIDELVQELADTSTPYPGA